MFFFYSSFNVYDKENREAKKQNDAVVLNQYSLQTNIKDIFEYPPKNVDKLLDTELDLKAYVFYLLDYFTG